MSGNCVGGQQGDLRLLGRLRRPWVYLLVVAATSVAILVGAFDGRANAAGGCRPYDFIGARGSGQNKKELLADTDYMGPEVHDLFVALQGWVGSEALSSRGIRYPAVGVADGSDLVNGAGALLHIGFLGEYTDSVRSGQHEVEERIRQQHSACPATKFILAGYSQGAQVVGDALQRMPDWERSLVVVTVLFGDPYFNPNSWSARSNSVGDAFDPNSYGILGVRGEWPESLHGRVFSYCHYHDIICNDAEKHLGGIYVRNYGDRAARTAAHVTPAYRSLSNHGHGDADKAARDIARVLGIPIPSTPYTGPLDIAFAIDSTGSMSDEIDQVKLNVTTLVSEIAKSNSDFRVALVDYKDSPDQESAYQSRVDTEFTNDQSAFDAAVDSLEAEGGGDEPESVYSGLMSALGLDWRPGVRKLVIQIGDAAAKDPEPVTGYTLHTVQLKALSVDPATIDSIQSGENAETTSSFSSIAASTGGKFLQLSEDGLSSLITSIIDDVHRSAAAPTAALTIPSVAITGVPVTLSAAASSDSGEPIVAFEWDPTGDGTFDQVTTDPVDVVTYPAPFSGNAVLRVRSSSGLTSTTTAPIVVGAAPAATPGRPRHLRGSVRRNKVVLSWRAGRGLPPFWFTIFGKHGKALTSVAAESIPHRGPASKAQSYEATIRGLRSGRAYSFSVGAGNDRGESAKAGPITERVPRRHRHR